MVNFLLGGKRKGDEKSADSSNRIGLKQESKMKITYLLVSRVFLFLE